MVIWSIESMKSKALTFAQFFLLAYKGNVQYIYHDTGNCIISLFGLPLLKLSQRLSEWVSNSALLLPIWILFEKKIRLYELAPVSTFYQLYAKRTQNDSRKEKIFCNVPYRVWILFFLFPSPVRAEFFNSAQTLIQKYKDFVRTVITPLKAV